jgi:inorganic phosphate transporter, PiT family
MIRADQSVRARCWQSEGPSDVALPGSIEPAARKGPDLSGAINPLTAILFGGVLAAMVLYVAYSIYNDIGESGTKVTSYAPFLLLFVWRRLVESKGGW